MHFRKARPNVRGFVVVVGASAILSIVPVLMRLRRALTQTAIAFAWNWVVCAWCGWLTVWIVSASGQISPAVVDGCWYALAALGLALPIAILGGRRPIVRVWSTFVLVPLVLVFLWPVASLWTSGGRISPFLIEEPIVIGYLVVLVMGAGNYIGQGNSLSALCWMVALLLLVLPDCPATAGWVPASTTAHTWSTLAVTAAAWLANWRAARRARSSAGLPLDRVWNDFRELFGIVWARRVLERFNQTAQESAISVRIAMSGFINVSAGGGDFCLLDSTERAAAECHLRWLLQKFVDREWIDRRLST